MAEPSRPGDAPETWEDTLADARQKIVVDKEAADAAAAAQVKKPNTAFVATLAVILTLIIVADVYVAARMPDPLPPAEQEIDLRWIVADVVVEIEVFREEEGHLPTASDLDGLLDEVISFERIGDSYRVVGDAGNVRVEYDGSLPLDQWVNERRVPDPEAGS